MVDPSSEIKYKGGGEAAYRPDKTRKGRAVPERDFKKVLGRKGKKDDEDKENENKVKEDFIAASKKKGSSSKTPVTEQVKGGDSLFELSRKAPREKESTESIEKGEKGTPIASKDPTTTAPAVPFDVQQRQIETHQAAVPKPVQGPSRIHHIVEKIVEKLTVMKTSDLTETTITIKNNASFEGTRIVIKEFDSAKGEFNIAFDNLTQHGKEILDANQNTLRMGLEQKGYVVHIITTSTLDDTKTVAESEVRDRPRDDQQEEHEDQPEE